MNIAESTHAKNFARHIKEHSERITRKMVSIEAANTLDTTDVQSIINIINEAVYECEEIKQVVNDMMPRFQELASTNNTP